jgi:hypothetical protein
MEGAMAIVHKQQNTPVIKNNHHQPKKVQKWQKSTKIKGCAPRALSPKKSFYRAARYSGVWRWRRLSTDNEQETRRNTGSAAHPHSSVHRERRRRPPGLVDAARTGRTRGTTRN